MRRFLIFVVCGLPFLLSCANLDPAAIFLASDYQLRCVGCNPKGANAARHDIAVLNGEGGYVVECSANLSEGARQLSFSATYIDPEGRESKEFSISIDKLNLDSKDTGVGCRLAIAEGANTYEGKCTKGTPSEDKPCQVKLTEEDGVISGTLFCDNVPIRNATSPTRSLVEGSNAKNEPAEITVEGCTGL